ncbi:uncharacterized protein RJT21DRAFT_122852 [Scheffersomyces amazonensis]|uniref:uncharacterized protein n=1 Tax=Scheffersomyces amazonensis TaxID=1078765 RepID=UPI00315DD671
MNTMISSRSVGSESSTSTNNANKNPSQTQQSRRLNKLLKKLKLKSNPLLNNNYSSSSTTTSSSSTINNSNSINHTVAITTPNDIFERSLESSAIATINNPEIPTHYNIENFTNPILDTTTEFISDPNVDFYNDVKLNYYDDSNYDESLGSTAHPIIHEHEPLSTTTSNNNSNSGECFSIPFRSRSRSIISNNLLNTLSQSSTNAASTNSSCSFSNLPKLYKRSLSWSNTSGDFPRRQSHQPPPSKETNNDESIQNATIDFYSFADMLSHEDEAFDNCTPIVDGHAHGHIHHEHHNHHHEHNHTHEQEKEKHHSHHTNINSTSGLARSKSVPSSSMGSAMNDNDNNNDINNEQAILDEEEKIALSPTRLPNLPLRRSSYTTISVKDYIGVL